MIYLNLTLNYWNQVFEALTMHFNPSVYNQILNI